MGLKIPFFKDTIVLVIIISGFLIFFGLIILFPKIWYIPVLSTVIFWIFQGITFIKSPCIMTFFKFTDHIYYAIFGILITMGTLYFLENESVALSNALSAAATIKNDIKEYRK